MKAEAKSLASRIATISLIATTLVVAVKLVGAGLSLAATVTPDPADLALARSLGQLTATLAHLGATEDWGALALSPA